MCAVVYSVLASFLGVAVVVTVVVPCIRNLLIDHIRYREWGRGWPCRGGRVIVMMVMLVGSPTLESVTKSWPWANTGDDNHIVTFWKVYSWDFLTLAKKSLHQKEE